MGDLEMPGLSYGGSQTEAKYMDNTQARVDTEATVLKWLSEEHPNTKITLVREQAINLRNYAEKTGEVDIVELEPRDQAYKLLTYAAPTKRLSDSSGELVETPIFARYNLRWKGYDFLLVLSDGFRGGMMLRTQFIVGSLDAKAQSLLADLLREAGLWQTQLHDEIWVFEQGSFRKDAALYKSVMNASWDDVILSPDMKKDLQDTVNQFFNAEDTYHRLRVPWKRGLVFYGPPGNGKTISLKATMNTLYAARDPPIPTIYVKSLPNAPSVTTVFAQARRQAPCLMVLEDLDSLVSSNIRSLFLNAVDGLSDNDGILIVGTTNHLEQLDPGIVKRPSRFDRKYLFPDPSFDERVQYCSFWQRRLQVAANTVRFPDKLRPAIARETDGFSFAYMQEAFISALLVIANMGNGNVAEATASLSLKETDQGGDGDDHELDQYLLWRMIKKQIENLRQEMSKEEPKAA